MPEQARVLLYISADDPRDPEVTAWLKRLEEAGLEIAHAAGHEAGRYALQTGVVSLLVLDQALGRTSCLFLLREGWARNSLDGSFILRDVGAGGDDDVFIEVGASAIYSRSELSSLDLRVFVPNLGVVSEEETSSVADSRAFMARISHDIRTPLHGIHGAMDLLEGTGMTPLQQDYLHIVRSAADALMSVVNDLVDYGNPRAKQAEDGAIPFEPRTCAERVASVAGPMALAKGLDFAHTVHFEVPWRVKGDPHALRQILNGLCGHLIRHAGHGAVIMEINAIAVEENAATLWFRVGFERSEIGLDPAEHEAPNLVTPPDDNDISLDRCSELIDELGGQLQAQETSSGTMQFEFSLAFEALPDKLPLVEIGMEALEGRQVLVVDDSATNRMVYREQLANWGCAVVETTNGDEALAAIGEQKSRGVRTDIALIDFAMPEMDGAELARAIRAMPDGKDIRLVLCTSTPRSGDAARMIEAGFDAYLTKPVRVDCLRKVMGLLLGSRPSERERTPLITQHVIAEMDRAARSTLYVGRSSNAGRDALAALQYAEFPCDTARFGDDTLSALSAHHYGSVLVDCRGALEEGLAEASRIRVADSGGRIPLLMILRQADTNLQASCLAAGGDAVLVEPIQRDELVSVLSGYLGLEEPDSFDEMFDDWDTGENVVEEPKSTRSPIDMDRLEEITAGDEELRQELIEMFLADTEERFAAIESAIADEDSQVLNRTAHSIKGSSANMGASTLQALAFALESLGSENRFDEAPGLVADLKNEFEVVKVFFGSL